MGILGSIGRIFGFGKKAGARESGATDHRITTAAPASKPTVPSQPPAHADEKTIRHLAEVQLGGSSTEESLAAFQEGRNPGGLHHRGHPTAPSEDNE